MKIQESQTLCILLLICVNVSVGFPVKEEIYVPGQPLKTVEELKMTPEYAFSLFQEIFQEEDDLILPSLSFLEENIGVQLQSGWLKEGDIFMEKQSRQAVRNILLTWRDRQVPYELDANFNQEEIIKIKAAMNELHEVIGDNCISFRPREDTDRDFVAVVRGTDGGCYSAVGRVGGLQKLSLAPRCLYKGTIFHELMHTLGFWHEHTRPDRDKYIRVLWDNIIQDEDINFYKMSEKDVVLLDQYDYYSVMHYSVYAFTNNENLTTIQALDSTTDTSRIGQRSYITDLDRIKMRKLYNCDKLVCNHPGFLKNGLISSKNVSIGARISYKCNDGFDLIGPSERVCTDNGTWTGDTPVCLDQTKGIYHYCNFDDSDICGWTSNWTWTSFPTPSEHTGPTWDHTWDSSYGAFVYADGETLQENGYLGLSSPQITIKSDIEFCMTLSISAVVPFSRDVMFADVSEFESEALSKIRILKQHRIRFTYSMYGEMMGSLNVSSVVCDEELPIQSWQGNQGNLWNRNILRLPTTYSCIPKFFQILFQAGKGISIESDIAIDDVLIADCTTIQKFLADQNFNSKGTYNYSLMPWPATK